MDAFPSIARLSLRMYLTSMESTLPVLVIVEPTAKARLVLTIESSRFESL